MLDVIYQIIGIKENCIGSIAIFEKKDGYNIRCVVKKGKSILSKVSISYETIKKVKIGEIVQVFTRRGRELFVRLLTKKENRLGFSISIKVQVQLFLKRRRLNSFYQ